MLITLSTQIYQPKAPCSVDVYVYICAFTPQGITSAIVQHITRHNCNFSFLWTFRTPIPPKRKLRHVSDADGSVKDVKRDDNSLTEFTEPYTGKQSAVHRRL